MENMKKMIILSFLSAVLTACASQNIDKSKQNCDTPVRDLTVDWNTRTYWCLPINYVPIALPGAIKK